MKDDPAIGSIRSVRHMISEECGHDPKRLIAYYRERQRVREAQQEKDSKAIGIGSKAITKQSS